MRKHAKIYNKSKPLCIMVSIILLTKFGLSTVEVKMVSFLGVLLRHNQWPPKKQLAVKDWEKNNKTQIVQILCLRPALVHSIAKK